mgnify:CR=1 FL=1
MITPIRTMTINQICDRKDDLLVSGNDIREVAEHVRKKTIDNFARKLCKAFNETDLKDNGYYPNNIVRRVAEELKAGGEDA